MKWKLLAVLALGLVVGADNPKDDEAKKELKKLQGTWQLVSEVEDGTEKTADYVKTVKFILDAEGNWKVEEDGNLKFQGTSKLDASKKPRTIDYTLGEGDLKGKVVHAIYEVDGDTFKHCWAFEQDRPTAFESKSGSRHTYSVFKRSK